MASWRRHTLYELVVVVEVQTPNHGMLLDLTCTCCGKPKQRSPQNLLSLSLLHCQQWLVELPRNTTQGSSTWRGTIQLNGKQVQFKSIPEQMSQLCPKRPKGQWEGTAEANRMAQPTNYIGDNGAVWMATQNERSIPQGWKTQWHLPSCLELHCLWSYVDANSGFWQIPLLEESHYACWQIHF